MQKCTSEFEKIISPLLDWYQKYKRDLPWRQDKNAYHIWISEIMLQQTRVEAVIDYYNRFIEILPNIEALAFVEEDELLKLWQGLGYYSRARNLQKAAKQLIQKNQTELPNTYQELIRLPGIGSYTAGAIASIAYERKVPAVDGNVLRVMTRILGSYDDIAELKTKIKYEQFLTPFMPENPGDFNQAMMELGATICIPNGLPRCNICPVAHLCEAYQKGLLAQIPVKSKKIKRKIIEKTVFLFRYQNQIAILKRPETGLLASLYEFPNIDFSLNESELIQYLIKHKIDYQKIHFLKKDKHIFTHLEWHMIGYQIDLKQKIDDFIWVTMKQLDSSYSLPTAFLKFIK